MYSTRRFKAKLIHFSRLACNHKYYMYELLKRAIIVIRNMSSASIVLTNTCMYSMDTICDMVICYHHTIQVECTPVI